MLLDVDWDHDAWCQDRLLRALPPHHLDRVLDVGCGAGSFAARLASRASHVDAIDRAPHMVDLARRHVPANVDVRVEDVTTADLPSAHYDVVTSISAFHHLDLTQVLPRLAETVRPGGLLIAVALPKVDLPRDLPIEAISTVGNYVFGATFRLQHVLTGRRPYAHEADVLAMPMVHPSLTTRQVVAQVRVLPNAQVRRLAFWRYELRWQRPA